MIDDAAVPRVRMFRCIFVAAQVEPAVADPQRLVDALLVELERQRRRAREDLRRSTWISISPVGMFGLTVSGARATTSPAAWITNSLRSSRAAAAASAARSGLTRAGACRPRRAGRRRRARRGRGGVATQPATVTRVPTSSRRELAALEVAPASRRERSDELVESDRLLVAPVAPDRRVRRRGRSRPCARRCGRPASSAP